MLTRIARPVTLGFTLLASTAAWATPPADSPYATDPKNEYVQDATSDGIDNLNMVLCIMNAMRPADMVNAGPYVALVDKNKCDTRQRASASNSSGDGSGATAAPDYMNAVVDVTRATNADPMIGKVWMSMTEKGHATDVYVSITATKSPTDVPPYGVFRLDYIGKAGGATQFNGYIDSASGVLKYLETGENSSNAALALSATSTTAGAGTMTAGSPASTFNFAYDASYFRRREGVNDQCFDRSKAHASRSVWRYGTYNANDGTRVDTAHPGFPITATYNGNSYYGFANYYNINFQGLDLNTFADSSAVAGLTISDQRPGNTTTYTLGKVGGKLTRWDQSQTTLAAMDGVPFVFNGDMTGQTTGNAAVTGFANWQIVWNNAAASFSVIGQQMCGNTGCVVTAVNPAATVNPNALSGMPIMGWSDSFGGNLNIPSTGAVHTGNDAVYYYTQSLVVPGSTSLTLHCLSRCPTKGSVPAANAYQPGGAPASGPFGANTGQQWFSAPSAANTVTYTFDAGGLEANNNGVPVPMVISNAAYFAANPQFMNGVMTGRLFTQAFTNASCPAFMPAGTLCEPANPVTYYTWQTGPNPWSQSLWLTNTSAGTVVAFDPPQNVPYTVTAADDPSGAWVGKNIQLQFNGFGNLFGIPGVCVNPVDNKRIDCSTAGARYVPSFALADGDTMTAGTTPLVVRSLDSELRLGNVLIDTCIADNLTLNPQTVPTGGTTDPSATIGAKPTPTVNNGSPKVIDGVIQ